MNTINLYAMRDPKTGFLDPVSYATEIEAKSAFKGALYSLGINGAMWKEYELYRVGSIDCLEGVLTPCIPPDFICSARSLELDDDIEHARAIYLASLEVDDNA